MEESSLSVTSTPNRSEKSIAGDRKRRLPQRHSLFFKQTLSVIYYDSLLERYRSLLSRHSSSSSSFKSRSPVISIPLRSSTNGGSGTDYAGSGTISTLMFAVSEPINGWITKQTLNDKVEVLPYKDPVFDSKV